MPVGPTLLSVSPKDAVAIVKRESLVYPMKG